HTRSYGDWSSDVCSSDLVRLLMMWLPGRAPGPRNRNDVKVSRLQPGHLHIVPTAPASGVTAGIGGGLPGREDLADPGQGPSAGRSEERRVGKGCGRGWGA